MTQPSLPTCSSGLRVFSACLLSALMIMMPFVQLAAAEQRSVARSQRSEPQGAEVKDQASNASAENLFVNPPALPLVGITATKTDTYTAQPGPAAPGDTITYTVDINNPNPPGTDATGVTLTDIIDANTTRFGADFDLKVSPLAINDTYAAEQGVPLSVSAPGVLTNDTGVPTPTATAIVAGPTTAGGTVTLNTDGSFTYTPINAGFTGPDSFTYTITNGNAPPNPGVDNQATVTINVDAAPTVQSTTPADNAVDQTTDTNITITFSEAVNVTATWFQIVCTSSGTRNVSDTLVTPNGSNTVFTINPNTDFTQGETCTVTVDDAGVSDQDTNDPPNNMAANYVFSFTMDAAPSVTATTPIDTATGVGTQSDITLTFSESVNLTAAPVTISCATSGTHNTYSVSASPNTLFTINPGVDFLPNELCTVTVLANQVSDTDSNDPPNNMVADYIFNFTTDAAPTVAATTPTDGATNQTTNTDITLTFSESVSLTAAPVTISCTVSGAHNAYTVSASPNTVFTINPSVDFTAGETCTVTVLANQVSDTDGGDPPDNMAANYGFSFSIDAAPTVTANTPLHNATQVANNTNISITFSESVNLGATPVTISCATSGLHTSAVSASPNTVFTVNPDTDFANGELCTVTVLAAQVTDNDANDPPDNMAVDFVFSFTIDQAPSVTTTVPANNANDVAQSSTITINFSENVNVAAGGVTINCGSAVAFTPALPQLNVSSLLLTPTGGLPPGSDCTVTVVAANVTDTDSGDPPDNMVSDHVFTFKVKPDAVDDTYPVTLVGNVSTNSFLIPYSVTTNDLSAAIFTISVVQANSTIVTNTITTTSANGGNIVMTVSGADRGKFTYDPPAGFEGTDTFTYTISRTDGGGTDTATVSIPISGMVWFINNNATSCLVAGCGRLSNPFSTLAPFNTLNNGTGNNPAANDDIFVYESVTAYTGVVTLLTGQRFIGQDATASLSTITGLTPPSGSPSFPAMNTGAPTTNITSTVNMETNSTVRGLSINVTGTSSGLVASAKAGLVVNDVATISAVNTTGVAASFTSSSGTFTFTDISASGSAAGLLFSSTTSGSTVTVNNVNTTSGGAVNISGAGTTAFTFNDVTSTSGGIGVSVNGGSGAMTFHAITVNGASKGASLIGGYAGAFTINGTGTTDASGGLIQSISGRGIEIVGPASPATQPVVIIKNVNLTTTAQTNGEATTVNCGITGASGANTNCSAAIHLNNVNGATINNVNINGTNQNGINGLNVIDLKIQDSSVTNAGNESGENGVFIQNLTGNATELTNSTFTNNHVEQFAFLNLTSGTLGTAGDKFTVSSCTFTGKGNTVTPGGDGFFGLVGGTSTANINIGGTGTSPSNFRSNYSYGVDLRTLNTGNATVEVSNNDFGTLGTTSTYNNSGIVIGISNASDMAYTISSNEIYGSGHGTPGNGTPIIVSTGGTTTGASVIGTISNNTIGSAGTSGSGCHGNCNGISLYANGGGPMTFKATVTGNQIHQVSAFGIQYIGGFPSLTAVVAGYLKITGNTITPPEGGSSGGQAISVAAAQSGGGGASTLCADIGFGGANVLSGVWDAPNNDFIRVTALSGSTFTIGGMPGSGAATASNSSVTGDINPYIASQNGGAATTSSSTGGTFLKNNGAACPPLLLASGGVSAAPSMFSLLNYGQLLHSNPSRCVANSEAAMFASTSVSNVANLDIAEMADSRSQSLTQDQLDSIGAAARARWSAAGLNAKQLATLRNIKFEIADLQGEYLGQAGGNRIIVDRDAGGKGWFVDTTPADDVEFGTISSATRRYTNPFTSAAGRIDLLTAIEHEIGHKLGLDDSYAEKDRDSIMYGYLTMGERRVPAKGQAANAQAGSLAGTHFLKLNKPEVRGQRSEVRKHHARNSKLGTRNSKLTALAPASGETLTHVVGALPAGKSVRITFKVTVNAGFSGPTVSNQGTVTGAIGGAFSILTDDPDVPPNTGETDPTVTQIVGPTTANDDAYNAFKNTPLNIAAPGVLGNDANVTAVTGVGGCPDVTDPFSGCATTAGGTVTMNGDGSFSYTPLAGFTGPDTFTYSVTGGTGTDTATVTITVVDTSAIYINEVLFDPPSTDAPNEYIELRGPASTTLPAGTYLVAIEGDAADNPGDVKTIINLSGLSFGSNGYLVLLQMSNTYVPAAGATVVTSTTVGFGGLPGGIWSADASATDLPDSSVTFMLIQTGAAPALTNDIDSNDDGSFDGTVYPGWNVRDSISAMNASALARAYGAFSFRNTAGTGTGQGGEVIVPFIPSYVGRICDSTGSTAADWLASGTLGGSAPNWTLGSSTETEPASFAGNPLDHIGTTNFVNTAPVNTVPGAQSTNEDTAFIFTGPTQISIADSDAGSNSVQVTLTATNGTMSLSGTGGLTFTPPGAGNDGTNDVTMVFTGTVTDINTALNNLTFTPTSNYNGPASVQIQTNDQGNTGGAACSTTQSDTDTVNITVNGANDAPVLDNTGNMALNSIPQDVPAASNPGTLVSDIILSAGGDRITDADAGAVEGIAVTAVNNTNGTWEFTTNGGGIWTAFGSPSDGIARLLASDANTRVRFQPTLGFSGTVNPGITFRAWDRTSGTNGTTANASINGGATAFSTATETASITVASTVSVQDATVAEPTTGTTNMVFTVTLNAPAPAGGAAVNFTTADEPAGPGKAVAGVCGSGGDYTTTSGTLNFAAGQQVRTISVPVCADGTVEPDETFLVNLSGAVNATIGDGTATGTITVANPAGTLLISEFRQFGPGPGNDPLDDFVEIYNNTNSSITVPAGGYGLFGVASTCSATDQPQLIGTIPAGTVIPARGHFLFTGPIANYSLKDYGGTNAAAGDALLTADLGANENFALFATADVSQISSVNRFDAVGFGINNQNACDLLREGSTLTPLTVSPSLGQHSYFRKMCDWIQGSGCTVPGVPKDTNDNSVDFWLADTTGSAITGRLGAPGPENLASPIRRDNANNPGSGGFDTFLLDGTVGSAAHPNRTRNGSDPDGTFGSMTLRYRVTNNTAGNVTRLRYRIVDISTAIQPAGPTADLRALTVLTQTVSPVGDQVTCTAVGAGMAPCTVSVSGTTLETPPAQGIGGGYNSTLSSGTVTSGTPIPPGGTILINLKLGVQKTGTFRFYIIVEALP